MPAKGARPGPRKDLTGKRFGKLRILRLASDKSPYYWHCKCDCGNRASINGSNILVGGTKSCGCLRNQDKRKPGNSVIEDYKFGLYMKSARERDIEFALSFEEFLSLAYADCYYCGEPPSQLGPVWRRDSIGLSPMNGVDRMYNDLGYIVENCVPCCSTCNYMKMRLGHDDFIRHAMKVVKHVRSAGIKPVQRAIHE